jgi:Tfp pilus assembly protein PilF
VRLANALVRAGKNREAIAALDMWAARSPRDTQVRLLLAGLLLETGTLDRARSEYEKLDVERRDDPIVLNNLAWIYQQQNNPAASSLARRAVLLRPNDATVLDTYGWILTSSGKPAEGVRYLERAVYAQPTNKDMNFHLGATHARLGNKDQALKLLRPLLTEKMPNHGDVETLVKQLES